MNLIESANKQKIQLEEDYAEKVVKINEDLQHDITSLQNEYNSELSNRTNSIYSSFGLFDSFEAEAKSDSRLTKNLKSQLKAYDMYSESLQRLRDREVSQNFIAELEGLGVAAVDEIRTISEMSDARLEEYINLWSEKHALAASEAEKQLEPLKNQTEKQIELLKENARTALDKLDEEFKQGFDDIEKTIESAINEYVPQMNLLGENLADGIIEGLGSRGLALSMTMSEVLKNAVNSAKDELGIHSPSRVMRDEIGEQMGKGIEIGLLGSIRNIDFSSAIDMFKTAFGQMFSLTGFQGRERTHINNNITVQSGRGQAIMQIEGRELAKILFPFLMEEQRIQGVNLIA